MANKNLPDTLLLILFVGKKKNKQKHTSSLGPADIETLRLQDAYWGVGYKLPKRASPLSHLLQDQVICYIVKEKVNFDPLPEFLQKKVMDYAIYLYKDCITDARYFRETCSHCIEYKRTPCSICSERKFAVIVANRRMSKEKEELDYVQLKMALLCVS